MKKDEFQLLTTKKGIDFCISLLAFLEKYSNNCVTITVEDLLLKNGFEERDVYVIVDCLYRNKPLNDDIYDKINDKILKSI